MTRQLALFDAQPHQPRRARAEPMAVYLAVLTLRKRGHRVIRAGHHQAHKVGRWICSTKQLVLLASLPR